MSQHLKLLRQIKDEVKDKRGIDLQPTIEHLEKLEKIIPHPHMITGGVLMYEGSPCAYMINPPPHYLNSAVSDWYCEVYALERSKVRFATAPWIPSPTFEEVHTVFEKLHGKK